MKISLSCQVYLATLLTCICIRVDWVNAQAPASLQTISTVEFRVTGSEPGVTSWRECALSLTGKRIESEQAKACLQQILATGFFQDGQAEFEPYDATSVRLVFRLSAPKLTLVDFVLKTSENEIIQIRDWIAKDPRTLRIGEPYDYSRELATQVGVQEYFRSQGRSGVLVRKVIFDYERQEARITFILYEGPRRPIEEPFPPYGRDCGGRTVTLNWADVDQHIPTSLLDRLVRTRGFACFDRETLDRDIETLRASGLFSQVFYTLSESNEGGTVAVALHARGKPLKVKELHIVGHGFLRGEILGGLENMLPLKVGGFYDLSNANETTQLIEKQLARPGWVLKVIEDAKLTKDSQVVLGFHAIAHPEDEISITGLKPAPNAAGQRLCPSPKFCPRVARDTGVIRAMSSAASHALSGLRRIRWQV